MKKRPYTPGLLGAGQEQKAGRKQGHGDWEASIAVLCHLFPDFNVREINFPSLLLTELSTCLCTTVLSWSVSNLYFVSSPTNIFCFSILRLCFIFFSPSAPHHYLDSIIILNCCLCVETPISSVFCLTRYLLPALPKLLWWSFFFSCPLCFFWSWVLRWKGNLSRYTVVISPSVVYKKLVSFFLQNVFIDDFLDFLFPFLFDLFSLGIPMSRYFFFSPIILYFALWSFYSLTQPTYVEEA